MIRKSRQVADVVVSLVSRGGAGDSCQRLFTKTGEAQLTGRVEGWGKTMKRCLRYFA